MKSGTKTTEFWISIAPVLIGVVESNKGDPEMGKYLIICGTALGMVYILSRTWLKAKGKETPEAQSET